MAVPPNVLLICVDDLRPELKSFGVGYIHSPNIDKLAERGRPFFRHYVQAPTCGASRYTLLTGRYGAASNQALFQRALEIKGSPENVSPSMSAWFRKRGYTTVSVGKVSHHPGGRGGPDWNSDSILEMPDSWDRYLLPAGPWQHPRGAMHGLANGQIRTSNAKQMDVMQSADGPDTIYPDGLVADEALSELDRLAGNEKPFFLAVGFIRPHLPFGAPASYMNYYQNIQLPDTPHPGIPKGQTTWHKSNEFMKYHRWGRDPNEDEKFAIEVRKHYAACVTYADSQVGKLLKRLNNLGLTDRTIIVLWGDHGWHLGEHAIWGKHALFEESLHSPLIISHSSIDWAGIPSNSMVETLDVFPTVCELAGLPTPPMLHGVSLVPILKDPKHAGHPAIAYTKSARTIRNATHRLIAHNDGHIELYDHTSDEVETRNVADQYPHVVKSLTAQLNRRLLLP